MATWVKVGTMGLSDLEAAYQLLEEGDLRAALERAERAYRARPKDPRVRVFYGYLRHAATGEYEGLRLMDQGVRQAEDPEPYLALLRLYREEALPAHLLDLAAYGARKGLPSPGEEAVAWAEGVLAERGLPLGEGREAERLAYEGDFAGLERLCRKRLQPYTGYLLFLTRLERRQHSRARALGEELRQRFPDAFPARLGHLLGRFPQEGPGLAQEALPLLEVTPKDRLLARGLLLLALGIGEGRRASALDRAFQPPLREEDALLEKALGGRGSSLVPPVLFVPQPLSRRPLPPWAAELFRPWKEHLSPRELVRWGRPFVRAGWAPEGLRGEAQEAVDLLLALERGEKPFPPVKPLGELLGASPEEREVAETALFPEDLEALGRGAESLYGELYRLILDPSRDWREGRVRRLLGQGLPPGVRAALELRLLLQRDPMAPLSPPDLPEGAYWPEEFLFTWLLSLPPEPKVERAFSLLPSGAGNLGDWTYAYSLRTLRLLEAKPWREAPLPQEGDLETWVSRIPETVRELWFTQLALEGFVEIKDLLRAKRLKPLLEGLSPAAWGFLQRLVWEESLPLAGAEEAVEELEPLFLAFVGEGRVSLPPDLRRALRRAL